MIHGIGYGTGSYTYIEIIYTSEAEASRSRLALGLGFCFDDVRVPVSVQREWRSGLAVRPHLPDTAAARVTAQRGLTASCLRTPELALAPHHGEGTKRGDLGPAAGDLDSTSWLDATARCSLSSLMAG